jgi:hypothetical protein
MSADGGTFDETEEARGLRVRLAELRDEHRALDAATRPASTVSSR